MSAPTLEYSIALDNTGENAHFVDTSVDYGVDGNFNYSDVRAVRFYRGNYIDDINVVTLENSGEMDQWREYRSYTVAPFTYDNKIIPIAGRFIPFITGVNVQTNSIMKTTGRYSPYINPVDYLPTANHNVLVLTPSDFGIDETIFPDRVYYGQQEDYIDTSPLTLSNVTDGNIYIVYGGATGTCTYNGSIYRSGEVFTAGDNNAVVFANGAVLKMLGAARFKYFTFTYNIEKMITNLTVQGTVDCNCTEELMYKLAVIRLKLAGIERMDIMDWTSAKYAQDTINDITTQLTAINAWYNENNS